MTNNQQLQLQAALDQQWARAEEFLPHYKIMSDAAMKGTSQLVSLLSSDEAYVVLVLKACSMVEAQCKINIRNREEE